MAYESCDSPPRAPDGDGVALTESVTSISQNSAPSPWSWSLARMRRRTSRQPIERRSRRPSRRIGPNWSASSNSEGPSKKSATEENPWEKHAGRSRRWSPRHCLQRVRRSSRRSMRRRKRCAGRALGATIHRPDLQGRLCPSGLWPRGRAPSPGLAGDEPDDLRHFPRSGREHSSVREQGNRPPTAIARRFMSEIEIDPEHWRERVSEPPSASTPRGHLK